MSIEPSATSKKEQSQLSVPRYKTEYQVPGRLNIPYPQPVRTAVFGGATPAGGKPIEERTESIIIVRRLFCFCSSGPDSEVGARSVLYDFGPHGGIGEPPAVAS